MKIFHLKIDKHAKIYVLTLFLLTIVFFTFSNFISIIFLILLLFTVYFFRDPDRMVPVNPNLILSPADGIITFVGSFAAPKETNLNNIEFNKISIFLNIFNVHINRIPSKGKITSIKYIKGKFLSATLDKSSDKNERNIISMEVKNKNKLIFVQIAGLIARRIVSNLDLNQKVNLGDRFGLIKFGSRVDLYIPKNIKLHVYKGQKVKGGETIFGDLENNLDTMGIEKK